MKLKSLPHSPYVRKVLITAHELGLQDRLELEEAHVLDPGDAVHKNNPVGKVPVLVTDGGEAIYDSTVICDYLSDLANERHLFPARGAEKWRALRLNALGDGLSHAATWGMRERIRPDGERSQAYIVYFDRAIDRCLEAAGAEVEGFSITIGEISLASALSYLDLRYEGLGWEERLTGLADWYHSFSQRPSMRATPLGPYDGPRNPPAAD